MGRSHEYTPAVTSNCEPSGETLVGIGHSNEVRIEFVEPSAALELGISAKA